jgi:hypothetical protein
LAAKYNIKALTRVPVLRMGKREQHGQTIESGRNEEIPMRAYERLLKYVTIFGILGHGKRIK